MTTITLEEAKKQFVDLFYRAAKGEKALIIYDEDTFIEMQAIAEDHRPGDVAGE